MGAIIDGVIPYGYQEKINDIVYSLTLGDNGVKQDLLKSLMRELGFDRFSTGTNRLCCYNDDLPEFVFKLAIDKRGVEDNDADSFLFDDGFLRPYITPIYDNSGIIEVAHRVIPFTRKEQFAEEAEVIYEILSTLSQEYLLDDVGEAQWANWGKGDDMGVVIIDFAYLTKLAGLNMTCVKTNEISGLVCGADLEYNETITALVCPVCGARRTFGDVKSTRDTSGDLLNSINSFNDICYDDAEYI